MNKLGKGLLSGAAGVAAFAAGYAVGEKPHISNEAIEFCAERIETLADRETRLPVECSGAVFRVFDMEPDENQVMKYVIPSRQDFENNARTLQENDSRERVFQVFASLAVGLTIAAITYYEWEINTPERRAQSNNPQE